MMMVLLVVSFFKFEAAHMGPGQRLRTPSLMTRGKLNTSAVAASVVVTVTLAVTGTDAMMPVSAPSHCGVNRHWQLEDVHEHDTSG